MEAEPKSAWPRRRKPLILSLLVLGFWVVWNGGYEVPMVIAGAPGLLAFGALAGLFHPKLDDSAFFLPVVLTVNIAVWGVGITALRGERRAARQGASRLFPKPMVSAGLLVAICMFAKIGFHYDLPFVILGAPGLLVVWVLSGMLSDGPKGPAALVEVALLMPAYWAVNTLLWGAAFAALNRVWRAARRRSGRDGGPHADA